MFKELCVLSFQLYCEENSTFTKISDVAEEWKDGKWKAEMVEIDDYSYTIMKPCSAQVSM